MPERPKTPLSCPLPTVPELPEPANIFPSNVPIKEIAKEDRSPFASDIHGVPLPPNFAWAGSLQNTSKPDDFYNGTNQDYYKFTGDHCFRPIHPASHLQPSDYPSSQDACGSYSICMDMKMNKVITSRYDEKEDRYFVQDQMRSSRVERIEHRKGFEIRRTTPICSGVILTESLVLSSATCIIEAQSAFDKLSNLQVCIYRK